MNPLNKTISIRALLEQIKGSTGMSDFAIAQAAGFKDEGKGKRSLEQKVSYVRSGSENISIQLVDWLLAQTLAGNTWQRVETAMLEEHFRADQIELVKNLWSQFSLLNKAVALTEGLPAKVSVQPAAEVAASIIQPVAKPPTIHPIVDKKIPRNTRSDFPTFHAVKKVSPNVFKLPKTIPMFMDLAAGRGKALERCPDFYGVREYIPHSGVHMARVQGHSMIATIRHSETILLQSIDDGKGVTLGSLMRGDTKTPFANFNQHVRHDQIWVLSVNSDEPTLKRVNIHDPGGDWFLQIIADNPDEPGYPHPIRSSDEVTFYAKMIGFVDCEQ